MPTNRRTFLREWRNHRNLTQPRLAQRMGTTTATVSRMEGGAYTKDTLEAASIALGVTPSDILGTDPNSIDDMFTRKARMLDPAGKEQTLRFMYALNKEM